ncbi:MAG: hypothetical protein HQK53_08310 [Oligoflexia bacterium]|nr:hypothetical protein [Oligoflexia bacterium]
MLTAFVKYFVKHIFWGKGRQHLLVLALLGLTISSAALLILQSTMGGMQRNLVLRSKKVVGNGTIYLPNYNLEQTKKVLQLLSAMELPAYPEYEIELLIRKGSELAPGILHGLDYNFGWPSFLPRNRYSITIGSELSSKLKIGIATEISMISPSHTNQLMGDVPRQVSSYVSEIIETNVPEVDAYHLWARASLVHNLIREKSFNRIRIYAPFDATILDKRLKQLQLQAQMQTKEGGPILKTWEQENEALVWAMNLETRVMIFLFMIMTVLVGAAITSGLMLFFDKIQLDLVSFWMLGRSRKQLEQAATFLVHILSISSTLFGLFCGAILLILLDRYAPNVMPDIFVEQKIPVYVTLQGVLVSFLIPYIIAALFSWISLRNFKKDSRSFTAQIRSTAA